MPVMAWESNPEIDPISLVVYGRSSARIVTDWFHILFGVHLFVGTNTLGNTCRPLEHASVDLNMSLEIIFLVACHVSTLWLIYMWRKSFDSFPVLFLLDFTFMRYASKTNKHAAVSRCKVVLYLFAISERRFIDRFETDEKEKKKKKKKYKGNKIFNIFS